MKRLSTTACSLVLARAYSEALCTARGRRKRSQTTVAATPCRERGFGRRPLHECRPLCCILRQRSQSGTLSTSKVSTALTGAIGSHHTSREPCDFSNNFVLGICLFRSQYRPTGSERRTERATVRNSHAYVTYRPQRYSRLKKTRDEAARGPKNKNLHSSR